MENTLGVSRMNEIIQAIGSVGFPIVACCGMFYLYNETITKIVNALDVLNKSIELLAGELKEKDKKE
ncbi:MAG: hypothetical protein IKB96_03110 [Prevotella sp.]|nr:hypothetical protein [Prevotella sp.]